MKPAALGILASGNGSNFEAIALACAERRLPARVVGLICNRPGAGVLGRAERLGVPACVLDDRSFPSRQAHEQAIGAQLEHWSPDWIVLAGYMRVLTPAFVADYPGRIVNIHPADTRLHRGTGGYEWAIARGLDETVATVHLVDEGLDSGPIVLQEAISILPGDSARSLSARGRAIEHRLYVRALARLLAGGIA